MKAWTVSELNNVVASLNPLQGTRLQEVYTTEQDVVLGFYASQGLLWLWIDLNAIRPLVLPFSELPVRLKWQKTPLHLFLKAHFVNRVLKSVTQPDKTDRILNIEFASSDEDEPFTLELRLFPHGRNVIARAGGKQIAWQKPQELQEPQAPPKDRPTLPTRGLEELREQWLATRQKRGRGADKPVDVRVKLEHELARREKAVRKVEEELKRKQELPWRAVGDWLKSHQSLDVPKEWEPFVDRRRKLSRNIEECYSRARDLEGKLFGTEKRLELLRGDVAKLQAQLAQPHAKLPADVTVNQAPQPLDKIDAQGRTLRISDEITVVAGKSAADNLKLLRKARSWDLWVHLRDYPSSHAIVFRNKSTQVGDAVLQQVFAWFAKNHFGQKLKDHAGERLQILVAECRFVRPIKGDRLGRVTYQNERVLIFRIPS